jgi:hypothetical protein
VVVITADHSMSAKHHDDGAISRSAAVVASGS